MDDSLLQLFIQLITDQIGLQIRPQDRSALSQKLLTRMKFIKIATPEKYYQFLTTKSLENQQEWRELVIAFTTIESYFMRDKGQFFILEKVIFPKLIEQKRSLHKTLGTKPTLRIWSAGCSTGEEPYSLAIILKQLIADWDQWKILILGTDINEKVIEKAQQGVYSPWSFRLVDSQVQKQYFSPRQIEWEINRELREIVDFSYLNLITDTFPDFYKNIYNIDLILCRNVFVYFEPKYISLALKKFSKTLRPGGYLITGHAEVYGQTMNEFQAEIFPESIVYQRREALLEERHQIDYSMTASVLTESSSLDKIIQIPYLAGDNPQKDGSSSSPIISKKKLLNANQRSKRKLKKKAYSEAIDKAQQSIYIQPYNFDANYLLAQIYANLGKYSQAIEYCKRASKVDSMSILPDYLQAQIATEQGDLETAKILFNRIICLCPSFVSAYLELGNIYNQEGKLKRAIKMYNSSCDILIRLPPHTPIEQQGKMMASQVLLDIKKQLLILQTK